MRSFQHPQYAAAFRPQVGRQDTALPEGNRSGRPRLKDGNAAAFSVAAAGSPLAGTPAAGVVLGGLADAGSLSPRTSLGGQSEKLRGVRGSAPGQFGAAGGGAAKQLLDTKETTEPTPTERESEGRAFVRGKLRTFRKMARRIGGTLKRSDYASQVKNDVASLLSCGTSGAVWYREENGEGKYHVRWKNCRHRLCPVCEYKKALHRRDLIEHLLEEYRRAPGDWALLTLTRPNASWDVEGELRLADESLKRDAKALRRKWNMAGYIAGMETTMNPASRSYHHHMHMLIRFPDGLPVENLYRRILWRGELWVPLFHDEKQGRWKIRAGRVVEWILENQIEFESDESFLEYVKQHPNSIQYQWWAVSGCLIAHIRKPSNPKEVAKYVGKWSEISELPPNVLVSFLFETRGLRRWILGGEFRKLSSEWEKSADEAEASGEGWQQGWDVREGLRSSDEGIRSITERTVEECLWSLYTSKELRGLYTKGKGSAPPWMFCGLGKFVSMT